MSAWVCSVSTSHVASTCACNTLHAAVLLLLLITSVHRNCPPDIESSFSWDTKALGTCCRLVLHISKFTYMRPTGWTCETTCHWTDCCYISYPLPLYFILRSNVHGHVYRHGVHVVLQYICYLCHSGTVENTYMSQDSFQPQVLHIIFMRTCNPQYPVLFHLVNTIMLLITQQSSVFTSPKHIDRSLPHTQH